MKDQALEFEFHIPKSDYVTLLELTAVDLQTKHAANDDLADTINDVQRPTPCPILSLLTAISTSPIHRWEPPYKSTLISSNSSNNPLLNQDLDASVKNKLKTGKSLVHLNLVAFDVLMKRVHAAGARKSRQVPTGDTDRKFPSSLTDPPVRFQVSEMYGLCKFWDRLSTGGPSPTDPHSPRPHRAHRAPACSVRGAAKASCPWLRYEQYR